MPRKTKAQLAAEAGGAVAAPAPQPLPPVPPGALPGGPQGFPPSPQFGAPPQFSPPPGPNGFAPPPTPPQMFAPPAPPQAGPPPGAFNFGGVAAPAPLPPPSAPPVAPPQSDLGAAHTVLPQVLQAIQAHTQALAQYHAEVLQALGQHNQQRASEHQEQKALVQAVLDHTGAIGNLIQSGGGAKAQAAPAAPPPTPLAPPPQSFQPPAPVPQAPPAPVQQAPEVSHGIDPRLVQKNSNFGLPGIAQFLERLVSTCNGHPYQTFIGQVQRVPEAQTAFTPDDLVLYLQLTGKMDQMGTVRA